MDLSKYHTEGKKPTIYNLIILYCEPADDEQKGYKKAEFDIMLDLKTLISKTATGREMTWDRSSMRPEERDTATKSYKLVFEKLTIRRGLKSNFQKSILN